MAKKKKTKKWIKFRHKVITFLARIVLIPFVYFKYGARIPRFKQQGKRQYLIMMNHQTDFDQFFIGCAFRGPVYYIASEDLFSNGFISTLLRYAVAPIPIKKQTTDVRAVMNCIKIVKEGGTIALAPEGNRTYSGKTETINPAIAGLAKALKLPIAFFRIEDGYGVHPRWSDNTRKGKMRAYVSKVVEYEEYSKLTDDELYNLIKKELYVNEGCLSGEFKHKNLAEYLERAIYVCPTCGLSEFESKGNKMHCRKCGLEVEYLPNKQLKPVKGSYYFERFVDRYSSGDKHVCETDEEFLNYAKKCFPFEFVNDWYEYQENFINNLNVNEYNDKAVYQDEISLFKVTLYKNKKKVESGAIIRLFGNRIEIEGAEKRCFSFDDVSVIAVLGRNKLNIYAKDGLWQIKGSKRFNALKYMHFFYRYNNAKKGDENGKLLFLGL